MAKRTIQTIIGLMCLALIGLIGFQFYWIKEAIEIRNEQFNQKVAESVQNVIHRLEKQEMVYLLQQRIELEQQNSHLDRIAQLRTMPSNRPPKVGRDQEPDLALKNSPKYEIFIGPNGEELHYRIHFEGVPTDVLTPNLKILFDHERIIDEFFQAQRFGIAGLDEFMGRRLEEEKKLGFAFNQVYRNQLKQDSLKEKSEKKNTDRFLKKELRNSKKAQAIQPSSMDRAELLREVMQDLVYTKRPIQERVNRFLMDTLLRKEFRENGITLPFEFAVQGTDQNQMLFSTTTLKPEKWVGVSYHAALFPNETTQDRNALYVYFPNQKQFIIRNVGVMLGGSGILILVIMVCFYLAVTTILRQKKLSDIKNDFVNNMTHEFKTPISTIALATEMAEENALNSGSMPRITRYLGIIKDENKRLGVQVEKVLQMALLDKGEVKLQQAETNIHTLIEKVLHSHRVQIEQKSGEVSLKLEAENSVVFCDPMHFYNVINNLIDNAIKYSPDKLVLKIQTKNQQHGLLISIADQGLGMNKDQQHRIFENFYRIPTGNLHDVKGFGLGLSYVKKMVEVHRGNVWVESDLGEGSTFHIWLPILDS
jgi:two-component system phosphate regulon sensor histidine kinase PhoR